MDTSINKFKFSRVVKLLKLDWSNNKGTIITGLLISLALILTPVLLFLIFSDNIYDAEFDASMFSVLGNLYITLPIISILFLIIVFRRANRNIPMHIGLIPATNKEKYVAIFIEWIIKQLLVFIILSLSMLKVLNYNISISISDVISSFTEIMTYTGDGILPTLNTIAIIYIVIMFILSDFTLFSMACITFKKGWQVVLFIVGIQFFAVPMIFSVVGTLISMLVLNTSVLVTINTSLTIILWALIIIPTIFNVVFTMIGYKQLKKKANLN